METVTHAVQRTSINASASRRNRTERVEQNAHGDFVILIGEMGHDDAFRGALERVASAWSVPCDAAQREAIARYADLLLTWTARINLTGAVSLDDLAAGHLPDSFALASRLHDPGALAGIDVGSGGGLPAIPLAVLCPELSLRLLEPIAKKAAFLRTAIRELGLGQRLTVDSRRADAVAPATFDVALSRATLPPPQWLAVASNLVRPGGRVFLLASVSADWSAPPPALSVTGQWAYADGRRWLVELVRAPA
ncbi:MAG TPA: RsmG family class I SAM-dependent methyltransferase [Polyangia bacterium]|jgi:16S rRNA (guanine527-N7)-methyltransferase|nr:RsmG family class I SAM-dependent methyltransferase [Polyangia bacterium]